MHLIDLSLDRFCCLLYSGGASLKFGRAGAGKEKDSYAPHAASSVYAPDGSQLHAGGPAGQYQVRTCSPPTAQILHPECGCTKSQI